MTGSKPSKAIALESRLKECTNVLTLGVRPNFSDYSPEEATLIRHAKKIYYPATFYADLFDTMGINTFPSYHTYKCVQDKIKQTVLFNLLEIPHPVTRVFYGNQQKSTIPNYFSFPFIAKIPRGSALGRGVYLIKNKGDLEIYLSGTKPAYIQEYLPIDRDIRVVIIGNRVVHAYWRIVPLALYTARKCRWDDVGIDVCVHDGHYNVLEANMKYGREGFRKAGIDYLKLMETMIENGAI